MDEQPFQPTDPNPLDEEQLRAAYEEQLSRIRVEDVLVQTVVSLLNLGARKAGLGADPGTVPDEVDFEQARQAIDGVRALMPLVEDALGPEAAQLREVLSQLQLAYARGAQAGGATSAPNESPTDASKRPGPAQASGRLWVPGQ